jgi:hypothetical protein
VPSSLILIQGYLKKHTGGIFFETKKRWASLTTDGYLSLAKRASSLPYNRIQILDFTNFNYAEDNLSLTFDSVEDGVLVVSMNHSTLISLLFLQRAIKFYCIEPPTFDQWTYAIQRVRDSSQHVPSPPRNIKFLKQKSLSMKALFYSGDEPRDSIGNSDSDLAQIDPVLVMNSLHSSSDDSHRKFKPEVNLLPNLVSFAREVDFFSFLDLLFCVKVERREAVVHSKRDGLW